MSNDLKLTPTTKTTVKTEATGALNGDPYADRINGIVAKVRHELGEQIRKWGIQDHVPIMWSAIITEECGEYAEAAIEHAIATDANKYRFWLRQCEAELVQVAASAIAALEAVQANKEDWFTAWRDRKDE